VTNTITSNEYDHGSLGAWHEFKDEAPKPEDLVRLYSQGGYDENGHLVKAVGSVRNPEKFASLCSSLTAKQGGFLFGQVAIHLEKTGRGKISLPYKAVLQLEPEFGGYEPQTTGDCVSHATRNSGMLDYCIDAAFGETDYKGRLATENIYGWRGHGGQGASCSDLCGYVSDDGPGGFLVRGDYSSGSNSEDLSSYNSRTGHNWGRRGTPGWLNKIAAKNKSKHVALITNTDELCDAIGNGYGVAVCSDYGFNSDRGRFGVARPRGSWSHAMTFIGCIDDEDNEAYKHYGERLFLIQNSWGDWISGPTYLDQPVGSFWVTDRVAGRMLNARGSWLISRVDGINRRDISYLHI
tara:strand:+ start:1477 stop:2529 length:1053 start_codon:yes stop_codon:yes gene_type:complete